MITQDDLSENRYLEPETENTEPKIKESRNISVQSMFPCQRTECAAEVTESELITADDLDSVRRAEIRVKKIRLDLLEARETIGPHGVRYDGIGGSGGQINSSKLERDVIKLLEKEKELLNAEALCIAAIKKLWEMFSRFPESKARLIFGYRYIDRLAWKEVARRLSSEEDTEDSVRQYHNRYIKSSGMFDLKQRGITDGKNKGTGQASEV